MQFDWYRTGEYLNHGEYHAVLATPNSVNHGEYHAVLATPNSVATGTGSDTGAAVAQEWRYGGPNPIHVNRMAGLGRFDWTVALYRDTDGTRESLVSSLASRDSTRRPRARPSRRNETQR
jgi:hypothetical protein